MGKKQSNPLPKNAIKPPPPPPPPKFPEGQIITEGQDPRKVREKRKSSYMSDYGKEIIIDLHECDSKKFTRKYIGNYLKGVCDLIGMERCKLHWWDDLYTPENEKETEPHLVGTTAIQFIRTSNITIHTLNMLKKTYINLFSCKDFDDNAVVLFSAKWFNGVVANRQTIRRI